MPLAPVFIWNAGARLDPLYDAEDASQLDVNLQGASASIPIIIPPGAVLGEITATPGLYGLYNDTLSDGSNTARMINRYRTSVLGAAGAAGVITWVGGEWGVGAYSPNAAPAFKSGDFDLARIIGLDANGVADMYGRIIEGAVGTNESDSFAQTGGTGTWILNIPAMTVSGVSYPAFSLTGLLALSTSAQLATAINNGLLANGIPAYVVATGGALGTSPIVVVWHGIYGNTPIVAVVDNTGMSGGTVVNTRTAGTVSKGVIRFG